MNTFRLPAAALAVSTVLAVAWSFAAGSCSDPGLYQPNCFVPTPTETGADGGVDPCHCNVRAPFQTASCPCTSTEILAEGETGQQVFLQCMALLPPDAGDAADNAAEGGPLAACSVPVCNGQCQPLPPAPGWEGPFLLSVGADGGSTECPGASLSTVWGYGNGPFACGSNASGTCSDLREICGPASAEGFLTCVLQAGDVLCPSATQYADPHYETVGDNPPEQFTFCCLTPQSTPMQTGRSE